MSEVKDLCSAVIQLCSVGLYLLWVFNPKRTEFLGSAVVTGIWANTFIGG